MTVFLKDFKMEYNRGYTNIVEVHNNLIEARYKFTKEQQLILLQVAKTLQDRDIYSKDMQDVIVNYSARELANKIGVNDLRHLRGVVRSLQRCIMSFKNLEENWEMDVNIFTRGQYFAGGEIEIRLDEYMIQFFKQLNDNYTKLNIKEIVSLKSKYSIRIYELSRKLQFIKPPYKREIIYSLDEFQEIVGSSYKTWQHLEEYVLKPAKKEINDTTRVYIDYEPIKKYKKGQTKGRKGVLEIKLSMNISNTLPLETDKKVTKKNPIKALLREFNLQQDKEITQYINDNLDEVRTIIPVFGNDNKEVLDSLGINSDNLLNLKDAINTDKIVTKLFKDYLAKQFLEESYINFQKFAENKGLKVVKVVDEWVLSNEKTVNSFTI